ncbi:MAG: hypothetical protein J6T82_08190 [Bacteroidaceae bacterium]|nr:hypothetical protein [Bacteroidaceae bacterium]
MNSKKEKFESLRLELQEFTPQEFCVTCWDLVCAGYGDYEFLRTSSQHNKGTYLGKVDKSSRHVIISVQQDATPTTISIQSGGYLWEGINNNNGHGTGSYTGPVSYFQYPNGTYHIAGGWNRTNHS